MRLRGIMNYRFIFVALVVTILSPAVIAEVLYVDDTNGNDANPGSREKPLSTLGKAVILVNNNSSSGPTIIKILPGIYNLTQAVVIKNLRPSDDFEFHHNIVTDTEYFWMRKKTERPIRYKLNECIINVNKFSGYGIESGLIGETGAEITYDQTKVIKSARITLVEDKNKRDYLHVVPGMFGYKLGAGLFKKSGKQ